MSIKFFIGPMSKTVVESVIEYNKESNMVTGFIPSRRQVAMDGGYVNNWSTSTFRKYVKNAFVVRDHGGPGQGLVDDDGIASLMEDCKYLDILHIDPWKVFPRYKDGLSKTVDLIKMCHEQNTNILFEVGTEEAIRKFESHDIANLLRDLQTQLTKKEFSKIRYCVIQSGTSLNENTNTGIYNKKRLVKMCKIVSSYGILSKEHNGDYLTPNLIKEKFSLGLDAINIAPEFGQLETKIYVEAIKKQKPNLLDTFWEICFSSGKWKKWVSEGFDPYKDKEVLINICGHYVFSKKRFIEEIKNSLDLSDEQIRK
jgi:D-tagatose-1,6-bisphosphate aldolase subunit GatZ/KbaZ